MYKITTVSAKRNFQKCQFILYIISFVIFIRFHKENIFVNLINILEILQLKLFVVCISSKTMPFQLFRMRYKFFFRNYSVFSLMSSDFKTIMQSRHFFSQLLVSMKRLEILGHCRKSNHQSYTCYTNKLKF